MPEWGNGTAARPAVDMESPAEGGVYLKVNNYDANGPALHSINNNAGASARGLKVQGVTEILGPNGGEAQIKIRDCEINTVDAGDSLWLKAPCGESFNSLLVSANELWGVRVDGTGFQVNGDANIINNLHVQENATIHGYVAATEKVIVGDGESDGLIDASASDQNLKIGSDEDLTQNIELSRAGKNVEVKGTFNVSGGNVVVTNGNIDAGQANNLNLATQNENAGDVILSRAGRVTRAQGILVVAGQMAVGDLANGGRIDTNTVAQNPGDLLLGTLAQTKDVKVGRNGQTVTVNGNLVVGGAAAAVAKIDAELDGASARKMKIGTQASTDDITLSRAGKDVNVADDLNVDGDLKVGPTDDGGVIDSGGTVVSPQHLKIGTSTDTEDVLIGRADQTVDMMAQARMNSNGIVMNGASSVTDALGIGFVVNAVGHGNGASIDFYINGVVQGWLDATGFVNAPLP